MRAMVLDKLFTREEPIQLSSQEITTPQAGPGEIRLRVRACGVCHTELDEIEGRTLPRLPIVLGHEVVGIVDEVGPGVTAHSLGQRVGVGWIYSSDGTKNENLSPEFRATGRDFNGGYAEFMVVPERYAYPIPEGFSDVEAAPLLCAGAIGYRAVKLTGLQNGMPVGFTGFGGSGHLALQIVRHLFPDSQTFVFARDERGRDLARRLGADWTGRTDDRAPQKLAAIVDTTPVWKPVVQALDNLAPGGRLVINAIRKEDRDKQELLQVDYAAHLWMEKEIKSVANITHQDISEFLPLADQIPLRIQTNTYRLSQANEALMALRAGGALGASVLLID